VIVSFHPCIEGDENRLCAGRDPEPEDLAATRRADAVILPQGCRPALYRMAADHCAHVFPNYEKRFLYPGKLGQARLFLEAGAPTPETVVFPDVGAWEAWERLEPEKFAFPVVFKFDWGGEGEGVHLVTSKPDLHRMVDRAGDFEAAGHKGFLLQRYISTGGRSLRAVVMGRNVLSYWRLSPDREGFGCTVSRGALVDHHADSGLQELACDAVRDFCTKTGIDLAGFDVVFPCDQTDSFPLFLEINYFFGRRGLGGSSIYYGLLEQCVERWLEARGLSLPRRRENRG